MTKLMLKLVLSITAVLSVLFFAGTSIADETMDQSDHSAGIAEKGDEITDYEGRKVSTRDWALSLGLTIGFAPD
jgi:hypothetical protein